MGVMMQTFHWDCPREDKKEFLWWNYINEKIPSLAKVGFTSLWLPPVYKAALVGVHEKYATGSTSVLYLDDGLYIMQRNGYGDQSGLVYVLNNRGDRWRGQWVTTQWSNAIFQPVAWWSKNDLARPVDQSTDSNGRGQFFAPARGFAVYVVKV